MLVSKSWPACVVRFGRVESHATGASESRTIRTHQRNRQVSCCMHVLYDMAACPQPRTRLLSPAEPCHHLLTSARVRPSFFPDCRPGYGGKGCSACPQGLFSSGGSLAAGMTPDCAPSPQGRHAIERSMQLGRWGHAARKSPPCHARPAWLRCVHVPICSWHACMGGA